METLSIATLNVQGIKVAAKREEIETWMKNDKLKYLLYRKHTLQQTVKSQEKHTLGTSVEKGKQAAQRCPQQEWRS